ncbi:MAG: hypothetical protein QM488_08140 [Rhizobiaceae bacterium]
MTVDTIPPNSTDKFLNLALQYHQRHKWTYAIGAILLAAIMMVQNQWWLFWPLSVWTVVYLVHYLIVKCMIIDDEWVEDRTLNTAYYAYDLDHIVNIRKKNEAKAKRQTTDINKTNETKPPEKNH